MPEPMGNEDFRAIVPALDKDWIMRSPYDDALVQEVASRYDTTDVSARDYIKYLKGIDS